MIMTLKAKFSPNAHSLSVTGDNLDNSITAGPDAAGNILINGGAVPIDGGTSTIAGTSTIEIFGKGGNDTITLDETNGALPGAQLFGGAGKDTITGGSGADQIFGGSGDDVLNGKGGDDSLFGGSGNDVLTGGAGTDQFFGQAGNDTMIWNPGDGSDVFEGGDGTDTAVVNGGSAAEAFTIAADGERVRFDRTSPGPFSIDIGTTENLVLNAGGGDDVITAGNGLASLIQLTIDGGAGNDTITGGDGNDVLLGGDGNDVITGGRGADVASLGAGDDVFIWNQGDGSDAVDGQAGLDTLVFNGAGGSETTTISANGNGATLTRDLGNIVMDLNNIERIQLAPLGGSDNVVVNDLTGTGVKQIAIDLGVPPGNSMGDGQADTVTINATDRDDRITVTSNNGVITVSGLATEVTISNFDANDHIVINGLGGDDVIDASGLDAGIQFTANGENGNDVLIGSAGGDTLIGGGGRDLLVGGAGDDRLSGGAGRDVLIGGTGLDVLDGGSGQNVVVQSEINDAPNDGSAAGNIALLHQFIAASFVTTDDSHDGTSIAEPPPSQPQLLTHPHA
jgi:Ca2+-binding RTX toxin-like protein